MSHHYSGGYAVAIVQNGKVIETRMDGQVAIPFGTDYAIKLINRNAKDAVAKVSIDGKPIASEQFIVKKQDSVLIECSPETKLTFRFESTDSDSAIAEGKSGPDVNGNKGLITVEWRPERVRPPVNTYVTRGFNHHTPTYNWGDMAECSSMPAVAGVGESGVTVSGDVSSQGFHSVSFDVDYSVQPVLTSIKIMGYKADGGIPRQGTNYCPACRTSTKKPTDKFCRECGEKLT